MNLTFPQHKKKGWGVESLNDSKWFRYKWNVRTSVYLNKTDPTDRSWYLPFPCATTLGRDQTPKQTWKKKAGKAMYKISKINTIFIINMLQNNRARKLPVLHKVMFSTLFVYTEYLNHIALPIVCMFNRLGYLG